MRVIDTGNKSVLAYWREIQDEEVLCIFNLSGEEQAVSIDASDRIDRLGNHFDGRTLKPYASHWLVKKEF